MKLLEPYPHEIILIGAAIVLLLTTVLLVHVVYMLILAKIGERWKLGIRRFFSYCVLALGILLLSGMCFSLIKVDQVSSQLGFRYTTRDNPEGEPFIITRIEPGKTMDQAGLQAGDQIRDSGVNDLYALLIYNQGSEVEIPVLRNSKPKVIRVTVPEMDVLGIRFWPFNKY